MKVIAMMREVKLAGGPRLGNKSILYGGYNQGFIVVRISSFVY